MQARRLPATHGWQWIMEGGRIWRRSPLLLTACVMSFWILLALLGALPYVGQVVVAALMPVFSVGLFRIFREVDRGGRPMPFLLFSAFRDGRLRALMITGIAYLLLTLGVLSVASLADGGMLLEILSGRRAATSENISAAGVMDAALIATLLSIPVAMAYWFAPLLAGLRDLSPQKALFFSFVACWRNIRGLVVFASTFLMVLGLLPGVLAGLLSALHPVLGLMVMAVQSVLLLPMFHAASYANAKDVFGELE